MTMTSKVVPYKEGFGPFAPEVYRTPAPYPVPRRHRGRRDRRRSKRLFKGDVDPQLGRVRRARAGAGRGRLHPDDARLPAAPPGAARPVRDPLRGRRGAVRLRPHRPGLGDRALRRRARPARLAARRSAAGCRSPPSPAAPRSMDAVPPGGLGGTFGGNPRRLRGGARDPRRARRRSARGRSRSATRLRARLEAMAPAGSEVRGLGPMLALELAGAERRRDGADHRRGARAGPDAPLVRDLRQRDPDPRAVHDRRRGARARARHPGGALVAVAR